MSVSETLSVMTRTQSHPWYEDSCLALQDQSLRAELKFPARNTVKQPCRNLSQFWWVPWVYIAESGQIERQLRVIYPLVRPVKLTVKQHPERDVARQFCPECLQDPQLRKLSGWALHGEKVPIGDLTVASHLVANGIICFALNLVASRLAYVWAKFSLSSWGLAKYRVAASSLIGESIVSGLTTLVSQCTQ